MSVEGCKRHFKDKGTRQKAEGVDELLRLFNYNLKNFQHIYDNNALIDMEVRPLIDRLSFHSTASVSKSLDVLDKCSTVWKRARGRVRQRELGAQSLRGQHLRRHWRRAPHRLRPAGGRLVASRQRRSRPQNHLNHTGICFFLKSIFFYASDSFVHTQKMLVTVCLCRQMQSICPTPWQRESAKLALHIPVVALFLTWFLTFPQAWTIFFWLHRSFSNVSFDFNQLPLHRKGKKKSLHMLRMYRHLAWRTFPSVSSCPVWMETFCSKLSCGRDKPGGNIRVDVALQINPAMWRDLLIHGTLLQMRQSTMMFDGLDWEQFHCNIIVLSTDHITGTIKIHARKILTCREKRAN